MNDRLRWFRLAFAGTLVVPLMALALPAAIAAPTPIRAAFVYPWYGPNGTGNWTDGSHFHPALGQYDSGNPTLIAAQIDEMKAGAIQAGIFSWWGQGTPTDSRFPAILAAAAGKSFGVTAYYEPEGQGDPTSAQIGNDLAYLGRYAADSNWLRVSGKPVLFVYASGTDACGLADRWAGASGRSSWYIVLKVFAGYASCANQPDSWHQYGPAARTDRQGSYSFSISPGFWKSTESTPRLARDPAAWNAAVCQMVASGTQWQLITTFSEWGEGTAVEPASEWQSGSGYGTYLDTLRSPSCQPTPSAAPSSVQSSTASPTSTTPSSTTPTASPTVAPSPSPTPTPTASAAGSISHVVIVWLENHEYPSVTGSSMPYLTSLAAQYGLASGFYGVSHPSLPNYLAVWSGSTQGVTDDASHNLGGASLSSQLTAAGKTWKAYQQDYPTTAGCHTGATYSGGVDGPGVAGTYARKHNPPMSFTSVTGTTQCANDIHPLAQFTNTASLTFVTPNLCNDAHDCSLGTADTFLRGFVPEVTSSPQWGSTLLIVSFDEGTTNTNGGGHIYTMVARQGMAHTVSSTFHNHYGVTRTVEDLFGLPCLANACSAAPLSEFLAP